MAARVLFGALANSAIGGQYLLAHHRLLSPPVKASCRRWRQFGKAGDSLTT